MFPILHGMPKFKFETQVQIFIATITIHNSITRKFLIDYEFLHYEDENIIGAEKENHVGEDQPFTFNYDFFNRDESCTRFNSRLN